MTVATPGRAVHNPFCTRHVRPGRIPPLDSAGCEIDLGRVLARLAEIDGSAAIVGPHGSGKTTLLGHLAHLLDAEGRCAARVRIERVGDAGTLLAAVLRNRRGGVVCVDSWERLGPIWARAIRWCAVVSRTRLLVTSHGAGSLPTLWECHPTPAVLGAVVARLPGADTRTSLIAETDVQRAFRESAGNIREALFLLYDTYEARARAGSHRLKDGL